MSFYNFKSLCIYKAHRFYPNLNKVYGRPPQYSSAPCKATFDVLTLKVVRVICDVGYLCPNFSLPRPLCSRLRSDVRDRQTSDAHRRLMPLTLGAGHNNRQT